MQPLISVAGGNYVLQSATAMQWRQWEDEIAVKPGLSAIALGALLTLSLSTVYTVRAQEQQSTVPDAPLPQAPPKLVGDGPITPGKGAGDSVQQPVTGNSASGSPATDQPTSSTSDQTAPAQQTGPVAKPAAPAPPPDILPAPGEGFG